MQLFSKKNLPLSTFFHIFAKKPHEFFVRFFYC